jgi:hypothetical protein
MSSIPPPAAEPDNGYNATWDPQAFPDTISGLVESRTTLKFRQPQSERTTFEKLVVQTPNGELVDVLCGRARLARLVAKHDPRPGDGVSVTAFGRDEKGAYQYGMNVDKSSRIGNTDEGDVNQGSFDLSAGEVSRAVNAPLDDEEA